MTYPVLRVGGGFWGDRVVAVYETHLLVGRRFLRRAAISEEICRPEGEEALRRQLSWSHTIAFPAIEEIREIAPPLPRYRSERSPLSGDLQVGRKSRLTARAAGGRRVRFALLASEMGSLRVAFAEQVGERYRYRTARSIGCLQVGLVLSGLPFLAFGLIYLLTESVSAAPALLALLGLALCALGLWRALLPSGGWQPGGPVAPPEEAAPATPAAPPQVRPLRSPVLGWGLKLLGLVYLLAMLSPLTDPLGEALGNGQAARYVWLLLWLPAPALVFIGYRLGQRPFAPRSGDDERRPILFLRPFEADLSTTLQPTGLLAAITGVRSAATGSSQGRARGGRSNIHDLVLASNPIRFFRIFFNYGAGSAEESLARFFASYGPVVAIGRPGERLATPGAARLYADDDQWRDAVSTHLVRAQAVVIEPGASAGIRWELEQVGQLVEPQRVLLSLVAFWERPQAYEELCRLVRQSLGVDLPRSVPYFDRPAFVYFEADRSPRLQLLSYRNPLLWPITADAADLRYSLQPFLQGMHGGEREPPRRPRWARGAGTVATQLAAAGLAVAVMLGTVAAVRMATEVTLRSVGLGAAPGSGWITGPDIPEMVARSPRITLRGTAVPYEIEIPEALVEAPRPNDLLEHVRQSPDLRLNVQIIAHRGQEDTSLLPQQLLDKNRGEEIAASHLERVRSVEQARLSWVEAAVVAELKAGPRFEQIALGTSGPRGTVFVLVTLVGNPDFEPRYKRVAEEILRSARLAASPERETGSR